MVKFGASARHVLCDRCRKILDTDFNFLTDTITWETVKTPHKGRHDTRRSDFCDVRCRIVYFKGWKYLARKHEYIARNCAPKDQEI
jgi:hypothetical protein